MHPAICCVKNCLDSCVKNCVNGCVKNCVKNCVKKFPVRPLATLPPPSQTRHLATGICLLRGRQSGAGRGRFLEGAANGMMVLLNAGIIITQRK